MKSISFILGFLILALALKPCSDGLNAEHENGSEISMEHNHQNDHDDTCAMLCVCNCCGISVTNHVPSTFTLHSKINISTKVNSHYESHYRFNILCSIWQPPQFSV
ncbi:hypothetical protein H2O64_09880 [Kordia sp. YSTF-M3]|uniref:Secreted protein n=1 Tax=Kordia aestuariivivens TaxID=2759037 RepID=A0ABR7Q8V3_9FLAO|nr:DUF6660 family protein [Kordia aestuariivivens]MBC8754980.1 hypothetical protein [Kordia aestuariivivens]